MIDVHSHIIFGVDDGPYCIEQSLEMIKEADRIGISSIIASPHFHEPIFNLARVEENYQELIFKAKDYDVNINMAFEVFVDPNNPWQIRCNKKVSLNKAGLMLFEFPFGINPQKCVESVCKLSLINMVPVIAHVERNRNFINNFGSVVALIKAGCYIQIDAASIVGVYGSAIKEYSKKLIKMRLVDMVASNAHCAEDYTKWYMEAYNNVTNWIGKEEAGMLFHYNAKNILEEDGIGQSTYKKLRSNPKNPNVISLQTYP